MSRRPLIALGLACTLATAACADSTDTTDTTVAGPTSTSDATAPPPTTGDLDPTAAIASLQAEMSQLAAQVESSQAAAELQIMWDEFQAELTAALADVQADGTLDLSGVETRVQEFEDDLDSLGDQVEPELRDAWATFRSNIEQLMS